MYKNRNLVSVLLVLFTGMVLFAQSAESDFEAVADLINGGVTITKYVGWDNTVVIPGTIGGKPVTSIGKEAFAKQENLTSVTIPDSVTTIDESAFSTNKLTSVTFGKGIVSIGDRAFYDNSLTSVTLPDTIKTIGRRAFSHNLLAKVAIPGFNTYIGELAFARNKQLTSITLGALFTFANGSTYDNDTYGWISFTSFIEEDKEGRSRGWETNDIGERGKNLFWDYVCNDRQAGTYTLDLKYRAPQKAGDFEYIATRYGAALVKYNGTPTAIQLPEKTGGLSVKYIDSRTFERKDVDRVRIPNGVTSIGANVFYEKGLTSVDIPDSVTYIGDRAFAGWSKLASVTLGKGLVVIRPSAFYNQKLTSVTIPDSVTYIGSSAFKKNQLTDVTIGKGITTIENEVFSSNRLTSVVIPNSVMSIGKSAFEGNQLTSVSIQDSVMSIGERAFENNKLVNIVIPNSVMSIGERAFFDDILSVTIGGGVALGDDAFSGDGDGVYNSNGKKAGLYTREYRYGSWTYAER
jgi:hypothetical protein